MKKILSRISRFTKLVLIISGEIFIVLIILAFTKIRLWAYNNLGKSNSKIIKPPVTIILLSGSGILSESGLLRAYFTAQLGNANPNAGIIISMPGDFTNSMGDPQLTARELILRGIAKERISFESQGRNTREQALKLSEGKTQAS